MTEETENIEDDNIQEQIIEKIKHYYESNPPITSRDDLDNFLSALELLDIWDSDDEKDQLWSYISKYMKDSKIDCEGTIKGIKDLFNGDEQEDETEPENNIKRETLLSRLSRISTRGAGKNANLPANKLALNKYKQRAIDEYDCLDNSSLIQFKKIFALLKLNKNNSKITYDELNDIFSKYKFIKIDINDLWRYLSFCVYEENLKSLEQSKEYTINSDILEEVQAFIDQKIINEDLDYDSDNLEHDNDNDNDSVSSGGHKKYKEEDALALVSKIIKQSNNSNENNMILIEIKNEIRRLNYDMVDCGYKLLNNEESTMDEMEKDKELLNEKIYQIEEFYNKTRNENENNISKMEILKENIIKINENIKIMKNDYKDLYEKYNNNQEIDIDEQTEKLLDENMMLTQEKENKEQEIKNLLEEKKNMRKEYQSLLLQYEDVIKEKNELAKEASEIKINNYKLKNDYDKLLNDVMSKMDSQEKEKEKKSKKKEKKDDKKEEKKVTVTYEDQILELKNLNKAGLDEAEKIFKKKSILKDMDNERLINYIIQLDKINQTLSNERNQKEQKIYEISQKNVELNDQIRELKQKNVELDEENKNMQKKIEDLNNDVKNNEIFRPSIAMNSQMRISRLSKLNATGINEKKFNIIKGAGFSTKKSNITYKLKDKNLNKIIGSQGQKTTFENISLDLYGVKEVDNEEEEQEIKTNDIKKEFNISNQKDFSIENKDKKINEVNISNNNDINLIGNQINKKENEISINNQISINNNENIKDEKTNKIQNTINNNDSISISNKEDKKEFKLKKESNELDISSNNKSNNNLKEEGISFDINKKINISNQNNPNAVIAVENINDINLSSGNEIIFDNKNDNIFETQKNDLFFEKGDKNDNKNNQNHVVTSSFFETKPETEPEKKEKSPKKEEIKEDEDNFEEMPTLKIDNLMGNLLDNETITSNANNLDIVNKNTTNISKLVKNEGNISTLHNEIKNTNNNSNNMDINKENEIKLNSINNANNMEIKKENDININDNRSSSNVSKNDDFERSRMNTVIINNNEQRSTGNLESIMLSGVQKEGFSIDNSSRNESIMESTSNKMSIMGENKSNEKKEFQIEKNKGREIVMNPPSKMFQNSNNNNFSINSNNKNKNNELLTTNKTLTEKEFDHLLRMSNSSSNKIELKPSHNNSVYIHNIAKSNYQKNVIGVTIPKTKHELEEMRNNNNDYYSLFQEEYVQKKLKEEKDDCTEFDIYSDQIFLLVDKKHFSKRYIMVTPSNLYIIEPKEMKFTTTVKKENILCFQISNRNFNVILFQINNGENILIETLRRMDLLSYLRAHFRNDKKLIKFKYEDEFSVKIKGKQTTITIKDKIFANLSNFDGAQKIGYLLKYKGKFIGTIFKEKLFILTSIGLIMFDEPSSPPKKLYPIIGSNIEPIEGTKYGRENCFKITFSTGKSKIFATRKRRERESWIKEFDRIIKEFQTKMKQLDTINKKFIESSDKSLLPQ